MIKDFVENDPCDMDSEKRLLINLTVTVHLPLVIFQLHLQGLEGLT
jgi:hypothetical protein